MLRVFIIALLSSLAAGAQQLPCAFDRMHKVHDGELRQKEEQMNTILFQRAVQKKESRQITTYVIPAVVHIIHNNGSENLADTTVVNAINQLNLRFQNAGPYYDSTGHLVNIQFCLASVDPQGNATTGITRTVSTMTDLWASNDVQMKNLSRWDPQRYYNIWSVRSIYGFNMSVSGYSSFPTNAGDSTDGVVLLSWALSDYVLTHESGHYLGLYHTFSTTCANNNCLMEGDYVCDTPPDTSHSNECRGNSCNTDADDTTGIGPFTTDVNELPNYMDYTACPLSFSQGQADRMENALTSMRSDLLTSMGCGFTGGSLPDAQISYTASNCDNGVVYFSDTLSGNVITANWDFNNDGIWDSFSHNPSYTFPATGTYTIKLLVVNAAGTDTVTQQVAVHRGTTQYYPIVSYNGIFTWWSQWHSCANWTISFTSAPGVSYLWSNGDTTQTTSFMPDTTFTITCTMTDSTGHTWTNSFCQPLTVRVYPPPPHISIFSNDSLHICDGDTVTFHSVLLPDTGHYYFQWYANGSPISGATDSVYSAIGYFPGIQYICIVRDSIGCNEYSNTLFVYSYNPPAMQSLTQHGDTLVSGWGDGNQWYYNGTPITGATGMSYIMTQPGCYSVCWFFSFAPACTTMSDTICYLNVGIASLENSEDAFILFPSPAKDVIHIGISPALVNSDYRITDVSGRIIQVGRIESENSLLNISALENGIYFMEIRKNNQSLLRKLLKE